MVSAKQAYFHAVAQHRQGLVAQANKNFGETVARTKVRQLISDSSIKNEFGGRGGGVYTLRGRGVSVFKCQLQLLMGYK